ncbi:MAG: iron chelate uptake ABC transporter family permease subunit [Brachybacterium sp.]|nr:iron chelate uptake ABC transporter family permease subunit [Brachybacterium sp.]
MGEAPRLDYPDTAVSTAPLDMAQQALLTAPAEARPDEEPTVGPAPPSVPEALGRETPSAPVPAPGAIPAPSRPTRATGAFANIRARRRFTVVVVLLALLAAGCASALLAIGNPMPLGSRGFWLIAEMRATSVVVIAVAAICQALATISFQTVANNRIITPSIMGFESLYMAIQTGAIFLLGTAGLLALQGTGMFLAQIGAMVGLSVLLYGWLLSGKHANMQVMLLIGIVLGGGLGAVSTFMQRLLTPSEFDVLTARMFGSVTNARAEYLPLAIPLVLLAAAGLWWNARRLNVLALGRDVAINLGIDHSRQRILTLVLVSVLMATSTALIGPMTFFGFLVATLTYQLVESTDHRHLLPVGALLAFVVLAGAYVLMNHVFYAQGVVSIIIELVGGLLFLVIVLRRGRL